MPHIVSNGNLAAAAAQALSQDQDVKSSHWLTAIFRVGSAGTPATAVGDVGTNGVFIYLEDGTTGSLASLPADSTTTATLANGVAEVVKRFRLAGAQKVKLVLFNANATTALPAAIDYFID